MSEPVTIWEREGEEWKDFPGNTRRQVVYVSPDETEDPLAAGQVDDLRRAKHLTDAECAAEVHWTVFHEAQCQVEGMTVGPGHPHFEYWVEQNHKYARWAPIIERFATHDQAV
ncbi:hypothetical protein [Arthrobacter woluwensis]|uniref:Uncharacterized protein n=1 Tax=Arthrobacter woluwensis TaxID=156980 RepID=A0A1H4W9M6_9MICC|nr:hypothetical protein [Arthrobacter woluwensis]SEC89987.1 hypothetical protein SAMN04489745_3460 [Arthrobacter woluwensis]SEC95655.1 hypothetical protein SAMN04489745_3544 [Arthrobacter woluwensis]